MILLNPGPANTTDTVKNSQLFDYCPRTKEFGLILQDVCKKITSIATNKPDLYCTTLFGSSGTGAIESVISSAISSIDKILVVSNGAYGKRAYDIANRYKLNANIIDFEFGLIDYKKVYTELSCDEYTHLFIVHSETTTGVLNNIDLCGSFCRQYNVHMIVDAMSSFGIQPIEMEENNISYLISSANKNIQGLPGTSFVIAGKKLLLNLKESKSYYFDLKESYLSIQNNMQTRFTPPVQSILALNTALDELIEETVHGRYRRYFVTYSYLVTGMEKLGFKIFTPLNSSCYIITCFYDYDHPSYNFEKMYNYLKDNGFTIYPGKMNNNTFRIANIGNIDYHDIDKFLKVLKKYLETL